MLCLYVCLSTVFISNGCGNKRSHCGLRSFGKHTCLKGVFHYKLHMGALLPLMILLVSITFLSILVSLWQWRQFLHIFSHELENNKWDQSQSQRLKGWSESPDMMLSLLLVLLTYRNCQGWWVSIIPQSLEMLWPYLVLVTAWLILDRRAFPLTLLLVLQNKKYGAGEMTLWVRALGEQARELESRSRVSM